MQANIKIMVNWEQKQITHTFSAPGTNAYNKFIADGFEHVGTVRAKKELPPGTKVYWDPRHFKEIIKKQNVVL